MNNIFISQTKGKSREVAIVLKEWLIRDMKIGMPWISTDIPGGDDWRKAVKDAVEKARFGILCITADNLENHWMIYEAGALDFKDIKVFPYVIDLSISFGELPEPIRDKQGAYANRDGTESLVIQINKALGEPVSESAIRETFKAKWRKLEERLKNIRHSKDYEKVIDDFIKIIIVINDFRTSLDYPALITKVLRMKEYDRGKTVDSIFKIIEEKRDNFIRKHRYTENDSALAKKVRSLFKKYFKKDHLRRIIIELEPIMKSVIEHKLQNMLEHIEIQGLEVFLRYHRALTEQLHKELFGK